MPIRIQIQGLKKMRILNQIQGLKKMQIWIQIQGLQHCGLNADPDPKTCPQNGTYFWQALLISFFFRSRSVD